ncbi:MAG TPA: DUF5693 family protein, partial [Halanaerobiales bacterium]|nr:DUF5693 family protein [Halanaerobiales bacterium]
MNKKILYLVIILTLIVSLIGIRGRMMVEQSNNNVEMAFDYKSLLEMRDEYDNQTLALQDLKNAGINSIALTPIDLKRLIKRGQVVHLTISDINKRKILEDNQSAFWQEFTLGEQSAFLVFEAKNNYYNNLY